MIFISIQIVSKRSQTISAWKKAGMPGYHYYSISVRSRKVKRELRSRKFRAGGIRKNDRGLR